MRKHAWQPADLSAYVDSSPINRRDPVGADWVDWIPKGAVLQV